MRRKGLALNDKAQNCRSLAVLSQPWAILIAGPTASGKSALALQLAERHDGVIVNADSMQVYRDLSVLSARPSAAEEASAPHRLYAFVPAGTDYTVGSYIRDAAPVLRDIRQAQGGASVQALITELGEIVTRVEASNDPAFGTTAARLRDAIASLKRAGDWLLARVTTSPNEALAGATPYLRLWGVTMGGCMLADEALTAKRSDATTALPRVTLARFFAEQNSVQAPALERAIIEGADAVNAADKVLGF